jgi:hypothetical protein
MKHLTNVALLIASIFLSTSNAFATIIVVNNSNANPGQFYYLQAAIDSAEVGDTLMIQPSNFSYGNVVLEKALTMIGIGHKPLKDLALIASIGDLKFGSTIGEIAGPGVHLIGLKFASVNTTCPPNGVTYNTMNITARNCDLGFFGTNYGNNGCYGYNGYYNCLVEDCVIRNLGFPAYGNNILIQNCVITTYNISMGAYLTNTVFRNNLFIYEAANPNQIYATGIVFENNIFYRFTPASGGLNNCVFNNNLTYQTAFDVIITGTNTGSNNIIGQDPLFINHNSSASPLYQPELYNYRLQLLSPGHNAGTDGQDIGPYGNSYTFSETGESDEQPVIRLMNLLNSTVPSNGTMNVHVKATGSKND